VCAASAPMSSALSALLSGVAADRPLPMSGRAGRPSGSEAELASELGPRGQHRGREVGPAHE
jgi:hypothetical protein